LPECYFGFYDTALVFDNLLHKVFAVSNGFPETDENLRAGRAKQRLKKSKTKLALCAAGIRCQRKAARSAAGNFAESR
jgi:hypothetical protein